MVGPQMELFSRQRGSGRGVSYDLRPCNLDVVREMAEAYHGYGGAGRVAVYAFAVYEKGRPVASYAWQPPAPGAALAVSPSAPWGALALSRMVAVPRCERALRHISKPLRRQMRKLIDRTRWPVLITYSDESLGHTGHVYKCSGWQKTERRKATHYVDAAGVRVSRYSAGRSVDRSGCTKIKTTLQRWEHRACPRGEEAAYMREYWERVPTSRRWASGGVVHEIRRAS